MDLHPSLIVALVLFPFAAAHADVDPTWPEWMTTLDKIVDLPDHMTEDEQATCTERILDELNLKLKGNTFTLDDVAPIKMASWTYPRMGLLRGGGYNIRLVKSGLVGKQVKDIHPGRFLGREGILKDGLSSSLHVVGMVDGANLMLKTADSVDFTAHIDSAYAYLPLGALAHLVEDVIGHATRDPCPAP